MQQALFQKQSESGSLQMYPVTSVKKIHSKPFTQFRARQQFIGTGYVDLGTTDRGHMALCTQSCEKKWAQRMQRWQHNWALRTRAKIYFSFRFKHYYRLTISAMHDYMKSKCTPLFITKPFSI